MMGIKITLTLATVLPAVCVGQCDVYSPGPGYCVYKCKK